MTNLGVVILGAALPQVQYLGQNGRRTFTAGEPATASYSPHRFFNQPLIFWNGRSYRRGDILGYHANKRGGVHVDFRRKPDEEDIDDVASHFGFEIIDNNFNMMIEQSLREAKSDRSRRGRTFDTMQSGWLRLSPTSSTW